MITSRFAVVLVAFFFAGACQVFAGSQPPCTVMIDWVNFVQVGATQYVAGPESPTVLKETDLGPIYAKVKFKVSGNVCDPNYHLKDGDAAFLDVGTPIYQVKGHAPGEQLAARFNDRILLYSAMPPTP